jgi:hypothetical protein
VREASRRCRPNTIVEIEFQSRDDQLFEDRGNVRKEVAFEFLSIATEHLICCAFLLENTGFDSNLLAVNGDKVPAIFFRILFFLGFVYD